MSETFEAYKLPAAVIRKADLSRMIREAEEIDTELESQKIRGGGKTAYRLPVLSSALSDFLDTNKIDIADDHARQAMKEQLRKLKNKVPVVHMTFASEPDLDSLRRLVGWFRENANPQTILDVGLQPGLIGGVYLRTPNHVHDFTMRAVFQSKRDVVIKQLEEIIHHAG